MCVQNTTIIITKLNIMDKEKEKLFSDFSPVSTEDWKNKIVEEMKGDD